MFEKFKNEDTDHEVPAVPKTEAKKFAEEVFIEVPKPEPITNEPPAHSGLSSDSIIKEISRLPDQSAVFEPCDINTWNEVYVALSKLKLHTRAKWDEASKVLRYR